jgi:hypothetical protein
MASKSRLVPGSPLSFMRKLSASVYLYEPEFPSSHTWATVSDRSDPRLVLIGGWMDASEGHLAKYVYKYHDLFPTSAILLIKSTLAGVNLQSLGRSYASAAVEPIWRLLRNEIVRASSEAKAISASASASTSTVKFSSSGLTKLENQRPRLLVHMLSGGGACSLHHLYSLLPEFVFERESPPPSCVPGSATGESDSKSLQRSGRELATGGNGTEAAGTTRQSITIPPYVSIFDSAPAVYDYDATIKAILGNIKPGLNWTLAAPAVHLLAISWWLAVHVMGQTDPMSLYGISVNDRQCKAKGEVRRCYIYSENDLSVPSWHIERHAREAEEKGFSVRMEKFEGSAHVSHSRLDPERYWKIVQEVWRGSQHGIALEKSKL